MVLAERGERELCASGHKSTLTGLIASDVMTQDVPTVERNISVEDYVHEVLRTGRRCHIVTGAGRPVGLVTLHSARVCAARRVGEYFDSSGDDAYLSVHPRGTPEEPALGVLERMQAEDINQMPVVSNGQIVGMIGRDTILRVLQTRLQLGHLAS